MTLETLHSLLTLLEDPDEEVHQAAEQELLRFAKTNHDEFKQIQERLTNHTFLDNLKTIEKKIVISQIKQGLRSWRLAGGKDLFEAWAMLSLLDPPSENDQKVKNQLNRLINLIWLELHPSMGNEARAKKVSHILFQVEQFKVSKDEYNPELYFLQSILAAKLGSPFSTSLLYFLVCCKLDIPSQLIKLEHQNKTFYFTRLIENNSQSTFYVDSNYVSTLVDGSKFSNEKTNIGKVYEENVFFNVLKHYLSIENPTSNFQIMSNIYIILDVCKRLRSGYKRLGQTMESEMIEDLLQFIDIHFDD